jgi:hypothetical protein
MICAYCGSMIPEQARVCDQCGAPRPLVQSRSLARDSVQDPRLYITDVAYREEPLDQQRHSPLKRILDPSREQRAAHLHPPPYVPLPVRSFRLNAVIAFVLYFPFFLPGLIASAVWWSEANAIERRTGFSPPGKGCLTALLLWGVLIVGFWALVFAVF